MIHVSAQTVEASRVFQSVISWLETQDTQSAPQTHFHGRWRCSFVTGGRTKFVVVRSGVNSRYDVMRSIFIALPPSIASLSALLRNGALRTKSMPTGQSNG